MESREHEEIDLRELLQIIRKRLWLIVLITIIATVASGIISSYMLTPKYQATIQILVNQATTEGQFNQGDIRTNVELINTYNVIMTSPRILDKVIEDYNLSTTYQELINKIDVTSVRNSQVMKVTVTDPSYEQAVYTANALAKTFQQEIVTLMNIDNVHIMAEAKEMLTPTPVNPKPSLNMAIAFILGLMVAVGLAFLLEYLDNTIKTEQDVERFLDLPVLGAISTIDEKTEKRLTKQIVFQMRGE